MNPKERSIIGCLLGTAIGDSLGLCCEHLSKQRQRRLFQEIQEHRFFFGKGMVSDDTAHTCMVAQALIASAGDPEQFVQELSWNLRLWFLSLPTGIGKATLMAISKLWLGFSAKKSGVFSAGNGPAMRSALIGVCYGQDYKKLQELVTASTHITHTDPKANFGALAVALAAYMASQQDNVSPWHYYASLQDLLKETTANEFLDLIKRAIRSAEHHETTKTFAAKMGLERGITGYVYHTVPPAIHCWLTHQNDFKSAITKIIQCGGDTDTTAAIVGAIIGASTGLKGIPQEWLDNLWEWPRTKKWMQKLGEQLGQVCELRIAQTPITLPFYGLVFRNLLFLVIALFRLIRRLFPPY